MKQVAVLVIGLAAVAAQAQECEYAIDSQRHTESTLQTFSRSGAAAFVGHFGIRDGVAYLRARYETQSRRRGVFSPDLPVTLRLEDGTTIELTPDLGLESSAEQVPSDPVFALTRAQLRQISAVPLVELSLHIETNEVLELTHRGVRPKHARSISAAILCLPLERLIK
jgi:hypothetical protein